MMKRVYNVLAVLAITMYVASAELECFDLTPFAINADYLSVLQGGGDVPDNAAVYFEIPSTSVPEGYVFCLKDILIPDTVGGNACNDTQNQCWLSVGHRAGPEESEISASQYDCLCSGSSMNPLDDSPENISDGCGLQDYDKWGLTCRDTNNGRTSVTPDGSAWISPVASAYASICSGSVNTCGVCGESGGIHPSFVVGVQWVSDLQDQCGYDPFTTYAAFCSTPKFSTIEIVGMTVGSALLFVVGAWFLHYYVAVRQRQARTAQSIKEHAPVNKSLDVEHQNNRDYDSPPVEEISITTDGSFADSR